MNELHDCHLPVLCPPLGNQVFSVSIARVPILESLRRVDGPEYMLQPWKGVRFPKVITYSCFQTKKKEAKGQESKPENAISNTKGDGGVEGGVNRLVLVNEICPKDAS